MDPALEVTPVDSPVATPAPGDEIELPSRPVDDWPIYLPVVSRN